MSHILADQRVWRASFFVPLLAFCSLAFAQVQSGRIVGTVFDPSRAAIPGAKVTVTSTATNKSTTVVTNDSGDFVVTPLEPGIYEITVNAAGFQTSKVTNVEVLVGQSSRIDVTARLGDISVAVEVTGTAPVLNTESGALSQIVTNTQIVNLPLNGRSFYELARLAPGAVLLTPSTGNLLSVRANALSGMSISGVKGNQTVFLMDGVDITDHLFGGTLIQTSIDALQEFQVHQSEFSAEFGYAGGALNTTTKSGTGEFHGTLFDFLRNDKLDARNFFAPRREILKRNQFGVAVGGPLPIPRAFFFVNYEATRERGGLVFNNIVPTVAMKNGAFSAPGLNTIYDPLTRAPFPGNIIPRGRFSRQAVFFNEYIPDPNTAEGRAVFAPSQSLDFDQFTIRVDQNITNNHRAFVRWSFHNKDLAQPNSFPTLGIAPSNTRGENVVAALSSNLRPTVINDLRFSYLPNSINLRAFLEGTNFNEQAGIRGFEGTGIVVGVPPIEGSFPDFSWSGYSSMNGSSFDQRPKIQNLPSWEVRDSVTWVKGRSIFKFGGFFRHWLVNFSDAGRSQGQWSFDGSMTRNPASPARTGDPFADWLLGLPRSVTRGYRGDWAGGYGNFWHLFAQEDLKVNDNLTLNLGLRYEFNPFLTGYRGQVGAFDGTLAKPIIVGGRGDTPDLGAQPSAPSTYAQFGHLIQTTSQAGLPFQVTHHDKTQFAPRFGLAWRPFGTTTVIRGGYGIFYETEIPGNRVNRFMVPFICDETVFNEGNRTMNDYFLGVPICGAGVTPSLGPTYPHMRWGYNQHWNFGVQRQLRRNTALEVNYVGTKGTFLLGKNSTNIPDPGPGSIQSRRPFPLFGAITYNSQDESSTYHSLQVKFERRLSAGFWHLVAYTFSKSLVHRQVPQAGGSRAWERSLNDFDIPHNLSFSGGYELPIGRGKRLLSNPNRFTEGILGGWQLQGILVARSGVPFTPTISGDRANTGVGGQRPNRIGSGKLANPTVGNWFDKSAFVVPAQYTYGNSGGFILRGGRYLALDFSIFKEFNVTDRSRLQFRAEAFNLTNTPSFNPPGTAIDTASGGRVLSTLGTPRQLQFALKFMF